MSLRRNRVVVGNGIAEFLGPDAKRNAALFVALPTLRDLLMESLRALRSPLPPSRDLLRRLDQTISAFITETAPEGANAASADRQS